jgi:hypothetical protein
MEPKPIDGFPDYTIHPDGTIYCERLKRFLNTGKDAAGYVQVGLKPPTGKRITIRVHQLVAKHFIPKQDGDGSLVDHIDHDRTNNVVSNLRWVTSAQNAQNTSAKNRDMYCIRWVEDRQAHEVSIPQPDGPNKYVGRAPTLEEAQTMRDNALKGIFPGTTRRPTYCITHRPEKLRYEVSIPIGPRAYKYIGHGKTLEEAQALRDFAIAERDADPTAWKPQMKGRVLYTTPS